MIVRKVCRKKCIGLDGMGGLWISMGSLFSQEEWKPILFNENIRGIIHPVNSPQSVQPKENLWRQE